MKTAVTLLLICVFVPVFYSCETDNANSMTDRLEGHWRCEETSSVYKSTLYFYNVDISMNPDDSTKVLIGNFYQLGETVFVAATLSGSKLYISDQNVEGGYTVTGSGTISSNTNKIIWSYSVDDGSGEVDNVTATYTKLYWKSTEIIVFFNLSAPDTIFPYQKHQ